MAFQEEPPGVQPPPPAPQAPRIKPLPPGASNWSVARMLQEQQAFHREGDPRPRIAGKRKLRWAREGRGPVDASAWDPKAAPTGRTTASPGLGESAIARRQALAPFAPTLDAPSLEPMQAAARLYDASPADLPARVQRAKRFGYDTDYAEWAGQAAASHAATQAKARADTAARRYADELAAARRLAQEKQNAIASADPGSGKAGDRRNAVRRARAEADEASARVTALERSGPPQTDPAEEQRLQEADREALTAALEQLRPHLPRDRAQQLVGGVGPDAVIDAVQRVGAETLAALADGGPDVVASVLAAFPATLPPSLSGPDGARRLLALVAAGATPDALATARRAMGAAFDALAGVPARAVPCTRLLGEVPHKTSARCVGAVGAVALLDLVDVLPGPRLPRCLTTVDPAALQSLLAGPGGAPGVAALSEGEAAVIAAATGPAELADLVALLGRNDRVQVVTAVLPVRGQVPLTQIRSMLATGVAATELAAMLVTAARLEESPDDVLAHLTAAGPADRTEEAYRRSVLDRYAASASIAPTDMGTATAASGATYTVWQHQATIDGRALDALLRAGRVSVEQLQDPFRTQHEQQSGGDTQEYGIRILLANDQWSPTRWVAHAHREKGQPWNKTSINHLKRWEQRRLKEALRIPISSELMAALRAAST